MWTKLFLSKWLELLPIVLYLLLMVVLASLLPDRLVSNFFHDDSFFYIKTAQNIHDGIGSKFDGINSTNGYHVLWMWLLVAVAEVSPFHGFAGIRPLLVVHAMLVACTCLLIDHQLLPKVEVKLRLGGIIAIVGATGFVDVGIESPILLLTAWAFICALVALPDEFPPPFRDILRVAVFSGCICLARSDAIMLVVSMASAVCLFTWHRSRESKLVIYMFLIITLPAILTFVAMGLCNLVNYGHFLTISSSLKTHWSGISVGVRGIVGSVMPIKVRMAGSVLVALFALPWLMKDVLAQLRSSARARLGIETVLIGANAYVVLHAVVLILLARAITSWYFALSLTIGIATGVYVGSSIAERLPIAGRYSSFMGTALLVVAVLGTVLYAAKRLTPPIHDRNARFAIADWLYQNIPDNQVIFQVDGTGITGYFSERSVINGDGLINSWEYQDFLRSGRISKYLEDKRVAWFISHQCSVGGRISLDIPTWGEGSVHLGSVSISDAVFVARPYAIFRMEDIQLDR